MDSFNVMIIEANSDCGLEFVKQLVSLPYPPEHVFATYSKEEPLKDLSDIKESSEKSKVILIKMDSHVTNEIEEAKERIEQIIGKRSLAVLINTVCFKDQANNILSLEILERQFQEYTLPPLMLLQTMLPLLKVGKLPNQNLKSVFFNVIEDNSPEYHPLFEISKVALNLALDAMADRAQKNDILVFSRCTQVVQNSYSNNFTKRRDYVLSILLHVLYGLQNKTNDCNFLI